MKIADINKYIGKEYEINNDCCTCYKEGGKFKKICNFYIKELSINYFADRKISFTVTLKNKNREEIQTIPIIYFDSPCTWLHYGFNTYKEKKDYFKISAKKPDYEKHMLAIVRKLIKKDAIDRDEITVGWGHESDDEPMSISFCEEKEFYFNDYNVVESRHDEEERPSHIDSIKDYIAIIDRKISVPLVSYLLLTVLSRLEIIPGGRRIGFIMSLTGATMRNRAHIALMYANVYNRPEELGLYMNDYKIHHLYKEDSLSDVRYKASAGKDSVLIAFEPDKRRCNKLNEIFGGRIQDKDFPIYSNCLITTQNKDDIPFPTFNIDLPKDFDENTLEEYFYNTDVYTIKRYDYFMASLYGYIGKLIRKLNKNNNYIQKNYNKFCGKLNVISELSEEGQNAAKNLCFSYYLYMKMLGIKECQSDFQIIIDAARRSFPKDGDIADKDLENCKIICQSIDQYFFSAKNQKKILRVDESRTDDETRMRYNEEFLFISADTISEILKIENCREKFSLSVKRAMAHFQFIKTYTKSDSKIEYSVHLPKLNGEEKASQKRFIAFDRKTCRKVGMFPNVEKYLYQKDKISCQIDVK